MAPKNATATDKKKEGTAIIVPLQNATITFNGYDSGNYHSDDSLDMGLPGIIALTLIGLVLCFLIIMVACSYLKIDPLPDRPHGSMQVVTGNVAEGAALAGSNGEPVPISSLNSAAGAIPSGHPSLNGTDSNYAGDFLSSP